MQNTNIDLVEILKSIEAEVNQLVSDAGLGIPVWTTKGTLIHLTAGGTRQKPLVSIETREIHGSIPDGILKQVEDSIRRLSLKI